MIKNIESLSGVENSFGLWGRKTCFLIFAPNLDVCIFKGNFSFTIEAL